jgi:hypothetical protein
VVERHILVVEDDQTLRDIIAEALLEDLLLRASCKALLWHRLAPGRRMFAWAAMLTPSINCV